MKASTKLIINIFLSMLCMVGATLYAKPVVNLYTYPAYFPPDVLAQFEKETGIHVNLSIRYGDNSVLFAKLKAMPTPTYDVAVVANYSVPRFFQAGLIQALDPARLPQAKHLTPRIMHAINPTSTWMALPFTWGTTGILVNTKYYPKSHITAWRDLWRPAYRQQLLLIDDMRDVLAMGALTLGQSPNTQNAKQLQALKKQLLALRPNIKVFSDDNMINLYVDEEIRIGMSWSGEAYLAQQANPALQYIYPKEGAGLWIDTLALVKDAPHPQAAYKLLNFLCRPDIAQTIMREEGVPIANQSAISQLPNSMKHNPIFNPPPKVLHQAKLYAALGEAQARYETIWQSFKLYTALGK